MGCCEVREMKEPSSVQEKIFGDPGFNLQEFQLLWLPQKEIESKAQALLEETLILAKNLNWKCHIENEGIIVKTLKGTYSIGKVPVGLACIEFECKFPSVNIVEALFDPEIRTCWDINLHKMTVLYKEDPDTAVIKLVKKFPFANREFIIKSVACHEKSNTTIVMHSVDYNKSDQETVRGDIPFCIIKIIEFTSRTVCFCIQQVDYKNENGGTHSLVATELYQWAFGLKKVCLEALNS